MGVQENLTLDVINSVQTLFQIKSGKLIGQIIAL